MGPTGAKRRVSTSLGLGGQQLLLWSPGSLTGPHGRRGGRHAGVICFLIAIWAHTHEAPGRVVAVLIPPPACLFGQGALVHIYEHRAVGRGQGQGQLLPQGLPEGGWGDRVCDLPPWSLTCTLATFILHIAGDTLFTVLRALPCAAHTGGIAVYRRGAC